MIKVTHYINEQKIQSLKKLAYVSGTSQSKLVEEALDLLFKTPIRSKELKTQV